MSESFPIVGALCGVLLGFIMLPKSETGSALARVFYVTVFSVLGILVSFVLAMVFTILGMNPVLWHVGVFFICAWIISYVGTGMREVREDFVAHMQNRRHPEID